ncbi:MAG: hypothetical protein GKR99_05565 [Rhodobacteraceae bacterium]|nr:hypothetical protein [Paracoccaceae bacterium]
MEKTESQISQTDGAADPQLQVILEKLELIQSDINAMDNDIADFQTALFRRVWIVAIFAVIFSVIFMRLLI